MTKYCEKCNKVIFDKKNKIAKRECCSCENTSSLDSQASNAEDIEEEKQHSSDNEDNYKNGKSSSGKSKKKGSVQPSVLLSTINPDLWAGLEVRILKAALTNVGETGKVEKSGNGWVNLKTKKGYTAKRAYHLELVDPPPIDSTKSSSNNSSVSVSTNQNQSTVVVGTKRKAIDEPTNSESEPTHMNKELKSLQIGNSFGAENNNKTNARSSISNDRKKSVKVSNESTSLEDNNKNEVSTSAVTVIAAVSTATIPPVNSPKRSSSRFSKKVKIEESVVDSEDPVNTSVLSTGDEKSGITEVAENQEVTKRSRSNSITLTNNATSIPASALPVVSATTKVSSSGRLIKSSMILTPTSERETERITKKAQPRKSVTEKSSGITKKSDNVKSHSVANNGNTFSSSTGIVKKTDKETNLSSIPSISNPIEGFSAFASNGPKLNALLCEVKRSIVVKYVERHQEKIKYRPNLLQWSLKINSKCIDVEYEKSIARKVILNPFCESCFNENLIDSRTCYNELCKASPIYWEKAGCRGVPPPIPLTSVISHVESCNSNVSSSRSIHGHDICLTDNSHSTPLLTIPNIDNISNGLDPSSTTALSKSSMNNILNSALTPRNRKSKHSKSPSGFNTSSSSSNSNGGTNGSSNNQHAGGSTSSGFMSPRRRSDSNSGGGGNILPANAKYYECGPFPTGGTCFSMAQISILPETIDMNKDLYSSVNHINTSSIDTTAINHYLMYAGKQIVGYESDSSHLSNVSIVHASATLSDENNNKVKIVENHITTPTTTTTTTDSSTEFKNDDNINTSNIDIVESKLLDDRTIEIEAGLISQEDIDRMNNYENTCSVEVVHTKLLCPIKTNGVETNNCINYNPVPISEAHEVNIHQDTEETVTLKDEYL